MQFSAAILVASLALQVNAAPALKQARHHGTGLPNTAFPKPTGTQAGFAPTGANFPGGAAPTGGFGFGGPGGSAAPSGVAFPNGGCPGGFAAPSGGAPGPAPTGTGLPGAGGTGAPVPFQMGAAKNKRHYAVRQNADLPESFTGLPPSQTGGFGGQGGFGSGPGSAQPTGGFGGGMGGGNGAGPTGTQPSGSAPTGSFSANFGSAGSAARRVWLNFW